jgi:hypothetical protein
MERREERNTCRLLVRKLERKRPLGRPKSSRVDNINMDLREIGRVIWTGLVLILDKSHIIAPECTDACFFG